MNNVDLRDKLEVEFLKDNYNEVIDLWHSAMHDVKIDFNKENDIDLVDIVVNSYIGNEKYDDALPLINDFLNFQKKVGSFDRTEDSDLSTFYSLKTEVFYHKKHYFRVYVRILKYMKLGGMIEQFPKLKIEMEEEITNKIMKLISFCSVLFLILSLWSLCSNFVYGIKRFQYIDIGGLFVSGLLLTCRNFTKRGVVFILNKITYFC